MNLKVIKDDKVAVLYSPGYGAGWYTWNTEYPQIVFDPTLVKMVEENRQMEITDEFVLNLLKTQYNVDTTYFYAGGAKDLTVCYLPLNKRFIIEEYDGSEGITMEEEINWLDTNVEN